MGAGQLQKFSFMHAPSKLSNFRQRPFSPL